VSVGRAAALTGLAKAGAKAGAQVGAKVGATAGSWLVPPPAAAVLTAGLCGAWLEPLANGWNEGAMPDISPLMLLIGVASLLALRGRGRLIGATPAASWLCVLALLVPSSLLAWAASGLYAGWVAGAARGGARICLLLLVGVAAAALWQALAARALGLWFMLPDAVVAEQLLRLLRGGVERSGNVLAVPGGHEIVVLVGCATLQALPLVVLGAMAAPYLVSGLRPPPRALLARAGLALAVYVPLNLTRLLLLGWSGPVYELVHGPLGQNIFDAVLIALVVLLPTPGMAARARPA
jgi:hypothetical protein